MSKLKKLEFIEPPISELDQAKMDEILAGWICMSFSIGDECPSVDKGAHCSLDGHSGNYCMKYDDGSSYCKAVVC